MPLLLDTHALYWLINGDDRLGQEARQRIDNSLQNDLVEVSAITFWELAMLEQRGRLELPRPVRDWREQVLAEGVIEIPISGDIGILAAVLADFHRDPADRIITATAVLNAAQLVTADTRILTWTGTLDRHNAAL